MFWAFLHPSGRSTATRWKVVSHRRTAASMKILRHPSGCHHLHSELPTFTLKRELFPYPSRSESRVVTLSMLAFAFTLNDRLLRFLYDERNVGAVSGIPPSILKTARTAATTIWSGEHRRPIFHLKGHWEGTPSWLRVLHGEAPIEFRSATLRAGQDKQRGASDSLQT